MRTWLRIASGIVGLVVVVALMLALADGPAPTLTAIPLIAASPAAAQTPAAKPGEPFYLKAIDHDKAKRGGTLRLAAHGPPSMFDIYASGTIANVGAQAPMYDLLVRQDPRDPKLPIIPSLATSWTISPDGMTYTFKLRQGVKFHDGTDFGAEDVKASFDRIVFPPPNLISLRLLPIKEIVVRDRHTVEMKLSEPRDSYTFLASLAGGWNVITSKEALDKHKGDLKQVDNFPGTGPFMHKTRTTESWEQVRNPNYWNPHVPYVDRIVHVWLKAWTPELASALLGGQVDWAMWLDPSAYQKVKASANMSGLVWLAPNLSSWIGFNNDREPFNDNRVRRALHLALDQDALSKITQQFDPTAQMADYLPPPYGKSYEELMKEYPYAPATREKAIADAKKLMADAGHPSGIAKTFNFVVRESPAEPAAGGLRAGRVGAPPGREDPARGRAGLRDGGPAGRRDVRHHLSRHVSRRGRPERHHPGVLRRQQDHGQEVGQQLHELQERRVRQGPEPVLRRGGPAEETPAGPAAEPDPQHRDAQHRRAPQR